MNVVVRRTGFIEHVCVFYSPAAVDVLGLRSGMECMESVLSGIQLPASISHDAK
jgi:hypothetical protein